MTRGVVVSGRRRHYTGAMEARTLHCADGVELAADWYGADCAGATVVMAGATGVRKAFYGLLAQHLAGQGLNVLAFDYRGIGASRAAAPAGSFDMRTWAEQDLAAAINAASAHGLPVGLVGHSFGGQALGLADNNTQVAAFVGISAQSGYWRNWRGIHRPKMWATMHLVLPVVSAVTGDLPAGMMGKDPLPKRVARQWAGWCRGPHYMCDDRGEPLRDGFQRWCGRAQLYHLTDDSMYAPRPAVEALASFYANARTEVVSRSPADWGTRKLEHFGFFRPGAQRGWDEVATWLREQLTDMS